MVSINESLGSAVFPLLASDVTNGRFPDPIKDELLALFVAATNAEFGTTAGSPWFVIREGTSLATKGPVNDSYPSRASVELLQVRKGDFPFLFLGRIGKGEFEGLENGEADGFEGDAVACEWIATWCLGPLRPGEVLRFEAALEVWFPYLIRMVCSDRCHPAHNGGAIPFGPGGLPLTGIKAVSFDAAAVEIPVGDSKELYYGVDVTLRTVEHGDSTVEGVPFLGQNHSIKVGGREGVVPLIDLNTDFPREG